MEEIYRNINVLESILDGTTNPTNLPFPFLSHITESFSKQQIIGSGGFGKVYKGVVNNRIVAVKRFFNEHTINEEIFDREVKNLLAVKHRNIVQFLGFCASTEKIVMEDPESPETHVYAEKRERLLCFEYISNGSLQTYINGELRGLGWHSRYQIIRNICEGLRYLHEEKHLIHRDLKPENILIDHVLVPKLADLGISKLLDDGASKAITKNQWFTRAYCAPEFMERREVSFTSDIYSLGVIITELVTGRRREPSVPNVLRRWRYRWNNRAEGTTLMSRQVAKCIDIARQCRKENPKERPSITKIISDLDEIDNQKGQISNPDKESQIIPGLDDLLLIEPFELHFPFEVDSEISCPLYLTNQTNGYIAFGVEPASQLQYCTKPRRGIVPPLLSCRVNITLQAQGKAPKDLHHPDEFIVRSTKVKEGLRAEDITQDFFSKGRCNIVEVVNVDVIFDAKLKVGELEASGGAQSITDTSLGRTDLQKSASSSDELIRVNPLAIIVPLEEKKVEFNVTITNITDDYVAFHSAFFMLTVNQYSSTPRKGIMSPRSKSILVITRVSGAVLQGGDDYMTIRNIVVTKNSNIRDITYGMCSNPPAQVKLPVILVATGGLRSWEVMPYSIPSLSPTDKYGKYPLISSSSSNELVQVDTHEFILADKPEKANFWLRIVNITDEYVAFFLTHTTSNCKQYITKPNKGILSPRSKLALEYTRSQPAGTQAAVQGDDSDYLYSTVVSKCFNTSDLTSDLFQKPGPGRLVNKMELPVTLVATNEPQSWEVAPLLSPTNDQMMRWLPTKYETGLTWVNSIDVHPTEQWIMTTQQDPYVRIWDYQTKQVKRISLGVHEFQVTSVKFIARKKWFVAGTSLGLIYLFSYDPLEQIHVVIAHSGPVNSLAIHPNEPYVLSASFGGDVKIHYYEEDSGEMHIIRTFSARNWCARCVVFDPSGDTFANACGNLIKIWNRDSDKCKLTLSGHSHEVTCLEFFTREDKLYLISGSQDRTAKIWHCEKGRCVNTLQVYSPVRAVCCHPDFPILVTGSYDGSFRIWNSISFRRQEGTIKFDVTAVNAIACLKESRRIVIGYAGGLGFAEIFPEEPNHVTHK